MFKVGGITLLIVVGTIVGVFALMVGWVAWRQHRFASQSDTGDLPQRIEAMAATYLKARPRAALVIGVHQRGQTWLGGFGSVEPGTTGKPPAGDTLFEIGSVTKVFTGIALAGAANDGRVKLADAITTQLPGDLKLANESARGITFKQLATHSSGLPRLPGDFFEQAKGQEANPYAGYSTDELFASLASVKLAREPGTGYEYSNYGAALLGQCLARAKGEPYSNLVQRLILSPLAMSDTVLVVDDVQKARFVGGYTFGGEATSNWDFDAFAPAGGFRSTANDMLKFIAACLAPDDGELGRALKLSLQVHSEASLEKVGLGWHQLTTIEDMTLWWHNGGTGGYVSYLGIDPAHQTGVIILANHGDALANRFDVDKIGVNILTLAAKVSLK